MRTAASNYEGENIVDQATLKKSNKTSTNFDH